MSAVVTDTHALIWYILKQRTLSALTLGKRLICGLPARAGVSIAPDFLLESV
jgi:PIN domain nuclease of toxin-antitoxin system